MRWFLVVMGALLGACARPAPRVVAPQAASPAVPLGEFVPGKADPARRARLEALGPTLDAFFESKLKESGATGLAVGLVLEGELVYARGFGVRDVASRTPIDPDSVFRIASMTKSFTALSVLKLRDEGKVSLDEPAEKYLPELAALKSPTRDAPPISLRLLLTNAAGLAYDDLWGSVTFGKNEDELATLLRDGVQLPTTPGTRYAYSNLGWALLGRTIERVSKVPYRDYVTDNVLQPLGMTSSVWDAEGVPRSRLAVGYRQVGSQLVAEPRSSGGVFAAGGGLYTSLRDYARYLAFQLAAYPPRDDPETGPVRRSTLREMHEGQRWMRADKDAPIVRVTEDGVTLGAANYGFGWTNATSCTDDGRVQHGGFEPGYFGWVVMMPKARIGFVALATSGPAGLASRFGVFDILRQAGLLDAPEQTPHPALAAAQTALPALVEKWDEALARRTFDPDSLKYSWNQGMRERFLSLAQRHGRCRSEGKLKVYGPLHADLRLTCERGAIIFDVLLSPATPPRAQHVEITEELLPAERTERMAKVLAGAIGGPEDALGLHLIAPTVDRARIRKALTHAGQSHSECVVERGADEVTHRPWSIDRTSRYRLRCGAKPLELTFTLDDQTGQVKSFAAHPPRSPEATCWQ
jgi:CubicO group peptidase (beta-lactamase class C family)